MRFTDDEVETAYYGLSGFVRERAIAQRAVPPEVRHLVDRLGTYVRMSPTRHETSCGPADQTDSTVWIGTAAVANMVSRSPRQVQRIADEIGGQIVSGRWMFRESDVLDWMEGHGYGISA